MTSFHIQQTDLEVTLKVNSIVAKEKIISWSPVYT